MRGRRSRGTADQRWLHGQDPVADDSLEHVQGVAARLGLQVRRRAARQLGEHALTEGVAGMGEREGDVRVQALEAPGARRAPDPCVELGPEAPLLCLGVSEALAEGMTVMDYAPNSTVAEDYGSLAGWVKSLSAPASTGYRGVRWSER